jgi:hypothetical protein
LFGRKNNRLVDYSESDLIELTTEELNKLQLDYQKRWDTIAKYVYPNIDKLQIKVQEEKKISQIHIRWMKIF